MEMMQRVWWTWPRLAEKLGWSGLLGLSLLLACILFYLLHVLPEGRSTEALEANGIAVQGPVGDANSRLPQSPRAQLARFDALLPSLHDLPKVLARLKTDANQNGVELSEGQFKLSVEPDSRIARYQMDFPVKAGYAATREFVRAVMRDTPAMALEELTFERGDANASVADSRIRFVLFVHAPKQAKP